MRPDTIYFYNAGSLDLDAIRVMGVSVKEGDTPIGYFGTGLKFAIATLLRTGHEVRICIGEHQVEFGTARKEIRGQEFELVTMNDEPLGFTTALGRDWKVWQAYRELHANCLDEGGVIADALPSGDFDTKIEVTGREICAAYRERRSIFLDTQPILETSRLAIHASDSESDPNTAGYFRGIRARRLPKPSIYTYDVRQGTHLTEDRTVASEFDFDWEVVRALRDCRNADVIRAALLAGRGTYEGSLDLGWAAGPLSEEFVACVEENKGHPKLSETALRAWTQHTHKAVEVKEIAPSPLHEADIREALQLLRVLDCNLERDEFKVVESLGSDVFGRFHRGEILLARKTLDRGARFIASTLYEEWIHKTQGLLDESRAMQDLLLDRLFYLVAHIYTERSA